MQFIDWLFVALPFVLIVSLALYTRPICSQRGGFHGGRASRGTLPALHRQQRKTGRGGPLCRHVRAIFPRRFHQRLVEPDPRPRGIDHRDHRLRHLSLPPDARPDAGAVLRDALQPPVPPVCRRGGLSRGHRQFRRDPGGGRALLRLFPRISHDGSNRVILRPNLSAVDDPFPVGIDHPDHAGRTDHDPGDRLSGGHVLAGLLRHHRGRHPRCFHLAANP